MLFLITNVPVRHRWVSLSREINSLKVFDRMRPTLHQNFTIDALIQRVTDIDVDNTDVDNTAP
jgi:hypothetical protein